MSIPNIEMAPDRSTNTGRPSLNNAGESLARYERELPAALRRDEEITLLPEDTRTPVIDAELQEHYGKLQDLRCRVEAEQAALVEYQAKYERELNSDRAAAKDLLAEMQISRDVIRDLEREKQVQAGEIQKLEGEKTAIATARAEIENRNRVAESVNAAKKEVVTLLEGMTASLPRLREIYQTLNQGSLDVRATEYAKQLLGTSAWIVEQNFRESVLKQLGGDIFFLRRIVSTGSK